MGGDRLAGPYRAHFARCLIADREYEIHHRRARPRELIPRLRAQPLGGNTLFGQYPLRERVNLAFRMAPGAIRPEISLAQIAQEAFGNNAPRRVTRAEKQRVERRT